MSFSYVCVAKICISFCSAKRMKCFFSFAVENIFRICLLNILLSDAAEKVNHSCNNA